MNANNERKEDCQLEVWKLLKSVAPQDLSLEVIYSSLRSDGYDFSRLEVAQALSGLVSGPSYVCVERPIWEGSPRYIWRPESDTNLRKLKDVLNNLLDQLEAEPMRLTADQHARRSVYSEEVEAYAQLVARIARRVRERHEDLL